MKNIFLFFVALIVAFSEKIHAYEPAEQTQESRVQNSSARPQKKVRNVDIFGNALYWHTTETIDWASTTSITQNVEKISFKTLSFNWSTGFRIGIGYNMGYDEWDSQLFYTMFTARTSDHASGVVTSAFLGSKVSLTGPYQTAEINLKLHYNMFDWDLGRKFWVGSALSLRPFVGFKGGWIDQVIHSKWQKPEILFTFLATENLKNNFRGAGFKGGVNGKWELGSLGIHSFSLFGDFSSAFMWGNWTIRDKFQDNFFVTAYTKVGDRNFGSFMLRGFVGFGWDFNFDADPSHFGMKLGYEIEDWLNQYQVFDDSTGGHNNDLVLQGLTLDLRFDF